MSGRSPLVVKPISLTTFNKGTLPHNRSMSTPSATRCQRRAREPPRTGRSRCHLMSLSATSTSQDQALRVVFDGIRDDHLTAAHAATVRLRRRDGYGEDMRGVSGGRGLSAGAWQGPISRPYPPRNEAGTDRDAGPDTLRRGQPAPAGRSGRPVDRRPIAPGHGAYREATSASTRSRAASRSSPAGDAARAEDRDPGRTLAARPGGSDQRVGWNSCLTSQWETSLPRAAPWTSAVRKWMPW